MAIAEQLSNREKNIRVHRSLVLIFLNDIKTIISKILPVMMRQTRRFVQL